MPDDLPNQPSLYDPRLAALIIDNALDYAIFTLDFEGKITSWSPGAERIFGYGGDEAVGLDFVVLFTASDASAEAHKQEIQTAVQEGRAEDSRWHLRKGGERFWGNGVTMRLDVPEPNGLLKILRDETTARLAEEQRVLLLHELNHRIKNTLATVQSIAEQTLRASSAERETRENLTDRLIALSKAHDVLVEESWAGAELHPIVTRALLPFQEAAGGSFQVEGPIVRLSPQQAVAMSMVLHELATNAMKHGALTVSAGQVCITWNLAHDGYGGRHLTLLWEESGGPAVAPPARSGFGSRLIARSFGAESGGSARLDFQPGGVRCVLQLPLSQPEELPMMRPPQSAAIASE